MHILYESKKVETLFEEDFLGMKKRLNFQMVKKIVQIENWLRASDTFYMYLSTKLGKPHSLKGNLEGCYGITITGNYRLVVCPVPNVRTPEALKICDTVLVKGAVDYHGEKDNWIIP